MKGHLGLLYILLSSAFLMPLIISAPAAHASCSGAGTKYNATAGDTDTTSTRGNFGFNTPVSASLCGSSWSDRSYVHLANSVTTRCDALGWIEGMWYFGYTDYGSSSTTNPAFEWIKYNIYAGGRAYSDVSAGTGIYPSFSDYINMTVRYDWTDGTGHDYYKIVYYDTTSGSVISITNLWVDSRGCSNYFQSEGFNLQNVLKGKIDSGQYRDTSYSWHDWSGYTLTQAQGGQEFCVQAVSGSNNAFRFGTYISGVCTTP